ncbi:hypothetical protein HPB50_008507 [Hyalomma asiaticum]|uniref:Uncharacterized protein n=1 Tax=Hyalomma asiaticum TaxID=266040 RepID=A0ACB7T3U5_HYAAI|nr:hypothetical protein HPB50_008507 [Hyalomma asiaticum]
MTRRTILCGWKDKAVVVVVDFRPGSVGPPTMDAGIINTLGDANNYITLISERTMTSYTTHTLRTKKLIQTGKPPQTTCSIPREPIKGDAVPRVPCGDSELTPTTQNDKGAPGSN